MEIGRKTRWDNSNLAGVRVDRNFISLLVQDVGGASNQRNVLEPSDVVI
jgi:hypothetical protein